MKRKVTLIIAVASLAGYLLLLVQIFVPFVGPVSKNGVLLPVRMMQYSGSFTLATFLHRVCRYARALEFYDKASSSGPAKNAMFIQVMKNQSTILHAIEFYIRGNHGTALDLVSPVITKQHAHSLHEFLLLGMCYFHENQLDKAEDIASMLAFQYPEEMSVKMFRFRIDLARYGQHVYEECRRQRCLPLETDPQYGLTVADLLWNMGSYQSAGELYHFYLEKDPASPEFLYRSALFAFRVSGDPGRARTLLERLLVLDYRFPGARQEYARVLLSGNWSASDGFGYFPEHSRLTMFQSEWPQLLGIILDGRRAVIEGRAP